MKYEIWSEGYRATGQSGTANFMGKAAGDNFKKACASFFKGDAYYSVHNNTYWACKLYDNKIDASRSFG